MTIVFEAVYHTFTKVFQATSASSLNWDYYENVKYQLTTCTDTKAVAVLCF